MIEVVFDGIGGISRDGCACCLCSVETQGGAGHDVKIDAEVPRMAL